MKLLLCIATLSACLIFAAGCGDLNEATKHPTSLITMCGDYTLEIPEEFHTEALPPDPRLAPNRRKDQVETDCGIHIRAFDDSRAISGLDITLPPSVMLKQVIYTKYKNLRSEIQLGPEEKSVMVGTIAMTKIPIFVKDFDGHLLTGFVMAGNDGHNNILATCFPTDPELLSAYEKVLASFRRKTP